MTTTSITPSDLGLPPKFQSWRAGQWESVETTVTTDKRFIAQCGPTGFGKTGYAVASAILLGGRAIYNTASKSLQDQLSDDGFPGLSDMRGRQNFTCIESTSNASCSEGRIVGCRNSQCGYQISRQAFLQSTLGLTNYAYSLSSAIHSEGVGPASVLICDEAHQLVQEVCSAIEVRLNHHINNHLYNAFSSFPPYGKPIASWRTWAKFLLPKVQSHLKLVKESNNHKGLVAVDALAFSIERLANVPESWILEEGRDETLISPLWPTDHTHKYLFRDIPKILLVSATVVPKTLQLLGVKEEDSLFLSQDHTFDANRCPVYLFGSCRVDHKMSDGQWQEVMGRMDTLIDQRQHLKGLIHTVSYRLQDDILRSTRHRSIMFAPKKASELKAAIEEYRKAKAPAILISPSITTGYDFPYSQAEFQIIVKIPFIDTRPPVMKARVEADPEYANYLTAQTLTQEIGRIMRAEDDRGETTILDQHANWFIKKHRDLFPPWFLRQVRYANELPVPPPALSVAA